MSVRKIETGEDWTLWRSDVVENNIEQNLTTTFYESILSNFP